MKIVLWGVRARCLKPKNQKGFIDCPTLLAKYDGFPDNMCEEVVRVMEGNNEGEFVCASCCYGDCLTNDHAKAERAIQNLNENSRAGERAEIFAMEFSNNEPEHDTDIDDVDNNGLVVI